MLDTVLNAYNWKILSKSCAQATNPKLWHVRKLFLVGDSPRVHDIQEAAITNARINKFIPLVTGQVKEKNKGPKLTCLQSTVKVQFICNTTIITKLKLAQQHGPTKWKTNLCINTIGHNTVLWLEPQIITAAKLGETPVIEWKQWHPKNWLKGHP